MIRLQGLLGLSLAAVLMVGCGEEVNTTIPGPAAAPTTGPSASTSDYPLTVCVVTGEKLGSMGDPVIFAHEGKEVRFCCVSCEAEFKNDPAKYMAKLDAAKAGGNPATQPTATH